jgi:hypothetical protein
LTGNQKSKTTHGIQKRQSGGSLFFAPNQNDMKEKRIIYIFLAVVFLSGCVTQKRCLLKFPPDTITKIETHTVTEWRDTTIFVHLPGDSVFVNVPIPVVEPLKIPPLTARLPLARSTAWVDNGLLNLGLWIDSTTYKFKLDSAMATVTDTVIIHNDGYYTSPGTGSKALHNNHLGVGWCRGGVMLIYR